MATVEEACAYLQGLEKRIAALERRFEDLTKNGGRLLVIEQDVETLKTNFATCITQGSYVPIGSGGSQSLMFLQFDSARDVVTVNTWPRASLRSHGEWI